ncbi:MAG: hypothetical protein ISS46_00480 [Candidatus Omnitrophica bacterium]|nr:hypothetical protein [Candidatus Omnitrophota bacterium]
MNKGIIKTAALTMLLLASLNSHSFGQGELEQKSKLAAASDVIGTWEMTYQAVRPSVKNTCLYYRSESNNE